MATIKSHTDISQSKTLSKILSIESADMYYPWYIEEDGDTIESGHRITTPNIGNFTIHRFKMTLPCWSLAALLSVLPFIDFTTPQLIGTPKTLYMCKYNDDLRSRPCDNPVDACYEMILKLHELNLL